jgi:hypothetical protein
MDSQHHTIASPTVNDQFILLTVHIPKTIALSENQLFSGTRNQKLRKLLSIKLFLAQVRLGWVKTGQITFEKLNFVPSSYHVFNGAVHYK